MAVTIESNPQLYEPVYNEMVYVVSSTNSGQTNFKYLADIYVNGGGTKEARLKVPIEPTTGSAYGIIDVHRILEAFLTSDIGDNTSTTGTTANDNSIMTYIVKFGEQYGDPIVQYESLTVDTTRYAWNGCQNYPDFESIGYLTYMLDDANAQFLTNAPTTIEVTTEDSGWLYYFHTGSPAVDAFELKTYDGKDGSGSLLGTWEINNSLTFASTGEYMGKVTSTPLTIGNLPAGQFDSGTPPVFGGTELSYTIQAIDSVGAALSELRTFNIIEACKYPRQTVHFLNELGGFDHKNFNLARTDSYEIERKHFKKNPQRITAAGNYPFSLQDRQKVQYYTKSKPKVKLTSDWLTEAESIWLRELVESPEIYLEDSSNNLIAVGRILNATYDVKTDTVHKLYNLEIELELSYDNYRQRG